MMPFAYYGAKHGLAGKYPPPAHSTIVEPFAGSAAYSVRHAARVDRVILIDADPAVVELWHRVKSMTADDLDAVDDAVTRDRTSDPLLGGLAGGTTLHAVLGGKSRQITPRMRQDWPSVRRRIAGFLAHAHKFDIKHGSYADADDIQATWFVDPPYQTSDDLGAWVAGNAYRCGAAALDFAHLGGWCRTRRGQVIVCEQSPASWLPFSPLARQHNGVAGNGATRTEVIWRNDAEQHPLFEVAS